MARFYLARFVFQQGLDAVTYSALKRSQVSFEVSGVYTHEGGQFDFQNAIGYKGKYVDQAGLDHTVYVVHGENGKWDFSLYLM